MTVTASDLDLLATRKSPPLRALTAPGPDDAALERILSAALRVPDHGRLAPWRIKVLRGAGKERYADAISDLYRRLNPDAPEEQVALERRKPLMAPVTLAVIATPREHPKIPDWEQLLSGGALCMQILLAAHALGFSGVWLTGWPAFRPEVVSLLGHDPQVDRIIGFVHLGTLSTPTEERPRPALAEIVSDWEGPPAA